MTTFQGFVLGSLRCGVVVSEIHIHIYSILYDVLGFQEINLVAIKDRIRRLDRIFLSSFCFYFFSDSCLLFYNINDDRISIGTKLVAVPKLRSADALVLVIRVGQRGKGTGG